MLRRPHIAIWVVVAILFAAYLALIAPVYGEICERRQDGSEEQCSTYQVVFFALIKFVKFINDNDAIINALSAAVVALFTARLWFTTRRMWRANIEQLQISRTTAERQLRAYVSVLIGGAVYQERGKGIKFEARPIVVNKGATPAHGFGYWANAAILPIPIPAEFDFPVGGAQWHGDAVLGPGHDFILSAVVQDFIDDAEVEDVKALKGRGLCVWGRCAYTDVFGAVRFTEFSQILRWLPDGQILGNYERHNRAT